MKGKKSKDCDPSRHLQESLGPLGPKSQKNLKKGLFGGLQKSPRKYPKESKLPIFGHVRIFLDFGWVFLGTFLQTPKKTLFEIFFAISGPEGQETPVNGGSGRQARKIR